MDDNLATYVFLRVQLDSGETIGLLLGDNSLLEKKVTVALEILEPIHEFSGLEVDYNKERILDEYYDVVDLPAFEKLFGENELFKDDLEFNKVMLSLVHPSKSETEKPH